MTPANGAPYVMDADGNRSDLSAYFMSANRNKRSVAVDLTTEEGQDTVRLAADLFIENFKPGGLTKYGLDYARLSQINPGLVYCSISGYGETGPNRDKPGYDLMAQGDDGTISLTGAPEGNPMKTGVGIADVMCGMYATVGFLAALRHRDKTGEGQHIDPALVDAQMAWLINEVVNYLTSGKVPERRGNAHPNIMPYDVYGCADGHVILAVRNDSQFKRFCGFLNLPNLSNDPRYTNNPARIENWAALDKILRPSLVQRIATDVISGLEALEVPVIPVQRLDRAFASDQAKARETTIGMEAQPGPVTLLGNPLNFSKTPSPIAICRQASARIPMKYLIQMHLSRPDKPLSACNNSPIDADFSCKKSQQMPNRFTRVFTNPSERAIPVWAATSSC